MTITIRRYESDVPTVIATAGCTLGVGFAQAEDHLPLVLRTHRILAGGGRGAILQTDEGFTSVGDLRYADADVYPFLADRRVDLTVTGGANVYPEEVEGTVTEHPEVGDCAVIGLPDEEWLHRVHAVVQSADPQDPPSADELSEHVRGRLAPYKQPTSDEVGLLLPRNEANKVRRSDLVAERALATA